MKRTLPFLFIVTLVSSGLFVNAQCTPGNEETCPDPENNGEICPDSLAVGYVNVPYSQEITILPPATYEFGGNTVDLHHVKLHGIDSLPPGLDWVSNDSLDEFLAGHYYCILIDGTPLDTGIYNLHINIEVFIEILSNIISVGTIQDSTLQMTILPESAGIEEAETGTFSLDMASPNPFSTKVDISFTAPEPQEFWIEIYDLTGQKMISRSLMAKKGINNLIIDGSLFRAGLYLCTISNKTHKHSVKLIKR